MSKLVLKNQNGSFADIVLENKGTNTSKGKTIDASRITTFVDKVEDLATVESHHDMIIVKDKDRGGIFYWDEDINPIGLKEYTSGSLTYYSDGGIKFAPSNVTSGAWVRQYEEVINIKWFSNDDGTVVLGNSLNDDTTGIQKALDVAHSLNNYITVIVPPSTGHYIFTQLKVYSMTTFKGAGGFLKLKDNVCVDTDASYYPIHNLGEDRVVYDGLYVEGNGTNNTLFKVADIITAVGFRTTVKNCVLYNAPDSAIMFGGIQRGSCINNYIEAVSDLGIYVSATDGEANIFIKNNIIKNCPYGGIGLKRKLKNVIVDGNIITNCGNGITHEDFGVGLGGHPTQVTIINNLITDIGYNWRNYPGVSEGGLVLNRLTDSVVSNNTIRNCAGVCISLSGAIDSIISNNYLKGYIASPSDGGNNGLLLSTRVDSGDSSVTTCERLIIKDNAIDEVSNYGLYAQALTDSMLSGNNINANGIGLRANVAVTDTVVRGNIIKGSPDTAIYTGSIALFNDNILKNSSGVSKFGYRTISGGQPLPSSDDSTFVARYAGEEVLHLASNQWFKAYGTAKTEWKALN